MKVAYVLLIVMNFLTNTTIFKTKQKYVKAHALLIFSETKLLAIVFKYVLQIGMVEIICA